jgi:hypothetical protein
MEVIHMPEIPGMRSEFTCCWPIEEMGRSGYCGAPVSSDGIAEKNTNGMVNSKEVPLCRVHETAFRDKYNGLGYTVRFRRLGSQKG